MTDRAKLTHDAVSELKEMRDGPAFVPTADIDMVWVLSGPGTALSEANDGIYSGASYDRANIDTGVQAILGITAARLNKPVEAVTKDDIEAHGPILFYNGEDEQTEHAKYRQNEDFEKLLADPEFPIPRSKVIIDCIPTIATPAQVKGLAEYLRQNPDQAFNKIAVVSLFAHAPRVGRYLEHHKDLFPADIKFINAPSRMPQNALGASLREVRKIVQYRWLGHLADDSKFEK